MLLTVMDRLVVLNVLPQEGDIITVRTLHELHQKLGFSQEEQEACGLKDNGGSVTFDDTAVEEKEIEIGSKELVLIVEALQSLDAQKKLTASHLATWDKFVT